MNQLWKVAAPLAVIAATVLFFFYPVFLQGKVLLPADLIVGSYYPWLDYVRTPDGLRVPIKNPITSDVISYSFPVQGLARQLLLSGEAPLWNPLMLMGTPLLANFQSAPFSITKLISLPLPPLDAWNFQVIIQHFLTAAFLFLLLREYGRSVLAALSGGLFFAFSGFMVIWSQWNAQALVASFFPLVFFLGLKWVRTGRLVWGLFLSAAFALQVFAGYPQVILYELPALAALLAVNIFYDRKIKFFKARALALSLFVLLGLGLAAVQILPGLELVENSQRKVEVIPDEWTYLSPQSVVTFFAPDFFGNHATYNWWGPGNYTLIAGYSGLVVLVLAVFGALSFSRRDPAVVFAGILVALSLAVSFANPLSRFLKNSGFLALQAGTAHRSLVLVNLGLAILASFGLDALIDRRGNLRYVRLALYLPTVVILGVGLGSLVVVCIFSDSLLMVPGILQTAANYRVGLHNLILPLAFLLGTALALLAGVFWSKLKEPAAALLVVMALSELFRFGWKYTPFSAREFVFPSTPVLEFLQSQNKPFRVLAQEVIPTNSMLVFGLEAIEGYDAVYPLQTAKYLSVLNSNSAGSPPQDRYGAVNNVNSPLLDLANVKYILALKKDNQGNVSSTGRVDDKFRQGRFKEVFADRSVAVLENLAVRPRARLYYNWEIEGDEGKVFQAMLDLGFSERKVVLAESPGLLPGEGIGQVKVQDRWGRLVEVESNYPGVLMVANAWYPGWKAFVNGQEEKLLRADDNFMAVPIVRSGRSRVELKYLPDSYRMGKMISLISGAVLLLALPVQFAIWKKWR